MDIDHEHTDEVICPHCGYQFSDSWEFTDDGEEDCPECEGQFRRFRNVSVTYSTSKLFCKRDGHKWRDWKLLVENYDILGNKPVDLWQRRCSDCPEAERKRLPTGAKPHEDINRKG